MAVVRFELVLPLFLILQTTSICRSVPVVTDVRMSAEGSMRHITVSYEAENQPIVLWKVGSFVGHLDNTTNNFTGSEGQATLHMFMEGYAVNIHTFIYGDSYQIELIFNKEVILNSSLEQNAINPLVFRSQPDGLINFDEGELVNIDLSLESETLVSLEMDYTVGILSSFDYQSLPPTETRIHSSKSERHRFYRRNSFILPALNMTRASTIEHTLARINTSFPYTEGEIRFVVALRVDSAYSLLNSIKLRHWVYLKNRRHVSPFQNSVSFVFSELDGNPEYINSRWPYTHADAMGYPKPVLKLFRDCREITEQEVETITTGTRYRTQTLFRFKNITDSLEGAYYVSASNGDSEVTKMYYIEIL
ncbi:uncharacterized protein [Haliotis cracherodii]|uniref:uncharacterized protein n=1 Tax=Haliotis cracherodii TaxID=6455 RepID=UPI0039E911B5